MKGWKMLNSTSIFNINIRNITTDFGTRRVGEMARLALEQYLLEHEVIAVDFDNQNLNPSFADECLGKLAEQLGLEEFKKRVRLGNVSESTKPLIRHVVLTRTRQAEAIAS